MGKRKPGTVTALSSAIVPAVAPISVQRTAIQDYWYELEHMQDLGQQWMNQAPGRLFVAPYGISQSDAINKTGITQAQVSAIVPPCKVLLPVNKGGNHWTAITADVTSDDRGRKKVKLSFTDSLNNEKSYNSLPTPIKSEISRIRGLFVRDAVVDVEIYPHTWEQADGSSCGPYSFANAVRCLDGKGDEPNPGSEVIRQHQLDMMTEEAGIRACSTNNNADEIIRAWVMHRMSENKSYVVNNDEEFAEMCQHFATTQGQNVADVMMVFINENPTTLPYVQRRMNELIATDELLHEGEEEKVDAAREPMKSVNSMQKFEVMRKQISVELGDKESYKFVAEIMQSLSQMHVEVAVAKITELENPDIVDYCIKIVNEAISTREIEEDYAKKIEEQANAYLAIHEAEVVAKEVIMPVAPPLATASASKKAAAMPAASVRAAIPAAKILTRSVKPAAKSAQNASLAALAARISASSSATTPTTSAPAYTAPQPETPVKLLKKHKRLLEQAIKRNNAGLVASVYYAVKDFTASLMSIITGGIWKPDYNLINELEKKINLPPKSQDKSKVKRKNLIGAELNKIIRQLAKKRPNRSDAPAAPLLPGSSKRRGGVIF